MKKISAKYLSDYKKPSFTIQSIHLTLELSNKKTRVTSNLFIKKQGNVKNLILNGENQKLISVSMGGHLLNKKNYRLTKENLTIFHVPKTFELKIQTEINPQENTSLSGLYRSGTLFCTQCEPEGFRRITYYLDRPDVMAIFTVKVIANKDKFPVLLSNGNCIETEQLKSNKHFAVWNDPFKKPSYLFAMVAGDLDFVEDFFITMTGRQMTIRIYSEIGSQEKCRYALTSVKKAMHWDEEHYGREYDLDIFMIVAVHDFNFGAMENKGLNIFNAKYIFVDPKTATDIDYFNVDRVVAHEYFHNWTGNRITLRDWFQICLKEGLTSFRDQSFGEDIASKSVARIDEVILLRANQFPEDAGPLAHSIRPESYIEIDNFYTMTVYEKGAEVIRMLKKIVGDKNYRKGTDLYFKKFDGKAVTCEDFLLCMESASQLDLSQFRLWYSQAGTPKLSIQSHYNKRKKQYSLTIQQHIPNTPRQKNKKPMLIPFKMGLINAQGNEILEKTLLLKKSKEKFSFENIPQNPIPSLLRNFSAPVKMEYPYTDKELIHLILHDKNGFSRWEAMQIYASKKILAFRKNISDEFLNIFAAIIKDKNDLTLTARLLTLPSEKYLAEQMDIINVDFIYTSRNYHQKKIAQYLVTELTRQYTSLNDKKPFIYSNDASANRSLKNSCLLYLSLNGSFHLAFEQFKTADNMTDKIASFSALSHTDCEQYKIALAQFYEEHQNNPLVIDKWFAIQAASPLANISIIRNLLSHPDFDIKNPNRVRSLLGTFSQNQARFHDTSGDAYILLMDYILKIDSLNPMLASRLIEPFSHWKRHDKKRQNLMKKQLERLKKAKSLSKNLYEIVEKTLP